MEVRCPCRRTPRHGMPRPAVAAEAQPRVCGGRLSVAHHRSRPSKYKNRQGAFRCLERPMLNVLNLVTRYAWKEALPPRQGCFTLQAAPLQLTGLDFTYESSPFSEQSLYTREYLRHITAPRSRQQKTAVGLQASRLSRSPPNESNERRALQTWRLSCHHCTSIVFRLLCPSYNVSSSLQQL